MNSQQNKNSPEYINDTNEQPRELTEEEVVSQQSYHEQLNQSLYGNREAFDGVEAGRYREEYRDIENADSLRIAEVAAGEDYSQETVKHALLEAEMYANSSANDLSAGHDQIRFGDVDARMSAELERAANNNSLGEYGTLHDHDARKVQEALAMEAELKAFIEGRDTTLFDTVDDSLAYAIKANIAQLVNKYGDVTKASNEELQTIYSMLEGAQNTKQANEHEGATEQKSDPLENITKQEASEPVQSSSLEQ